MLKDSYYDVPIPSEKDDIDSQNQIPPRKLVDPINYDTSNITLEELKARLATFDALRQVHLSSLMRYKKGGRSS